jgi:hypothetical protein
MCVYPTFEFQSRIPDIFYEGAVGELKRVSYRRENEQIPDRSFRLLSTRSKPWEGLLAGRW